MPPNQQLTSVAAKAAATGQQIREAQQQRAVAADIVIKASEQKSPVSGIAQAASDEVDIQAERIALLKQQQSKQLQEYSVRTQQEFRSPQRARSVSPVSRYRGGVGAAALATSALQQYQERRSQPTSLDMLSGSSPTSKQLLQRAVENRKNQALLVQLLSRLLPPIQQRIQEHITESRRRAAVMKTIKKGTTVGALGTIAVIVAVFVAVIADIMSIIDLQWLISWIIPIVSVYIVYRTRIIERFLNGLTDAPLKDMTRRKTIIERRSASLATSQNIPPPPRFDIKRSTAPVPSFLNFVIETVLVQLIELIPLVGIIPTLTTQVVRTSRKLYRASGRGNAVLVGFRNGSQGMDALEQWEIAAYSAALQRPLALLVLLQQQEDDMIREADRLSTADAVYEMVAAIPATSNTR